MMEKIAPFLDLNRYSSLPRLGPIPVPPHSMLSPLLDAPSLDCDGNNSVAQEIRSADGRSEHSGSERLQGWLDETRPGQVFGLDRGPFCDSKAHSIMRDALELKYAGHPCQSEGARCVR